MAEPSGRPRTQRGLVFPSPVVILSIVAVAMAAVAFFATRGAAPDEREVATPVRTEQTPSADAEPSDEPTERDKPRKPPVDRADVTIDVYNNTNVSGLASSAAEDAQAVGWTVAATDNWYGTIPATTVYFPDGLKRAARLLARDLGVDRTMPAVEGMSDDRLTLILTGAL